MLFLIIPVLYLLLGTIIARQDYARRLNDSGTTELRAQKYAMYDKTLKNIKHTSGCWIGSYNYIYDGSDGKNCDCSKSGEWNTALRKRNKNISDEIPGPYRMLALWPLIGYHHFLTNGTPKASKIEISNEARIAQLEAELEMSPLKELK